MNDERNAVIQNIARAAQAEDFYAKVELHDPVLTPDQCRDIAHGYLKNLSKGSYRAKNLLARGIANFGSWFFHRKLEIVEHVNVPKLPCGAMITSNHFGPLENLIIRRYVRKLQGRKRLFIISQITNFAMTGAVGFLMNYADTIPLWEDVRYLNREFPARLQQLFNQNQMVLIYPEQEMWHNYRKPRPPKRGAYLFAAKANVPVICCFVEMQEDEKGKVRHILHILDVLYPDPTKTPKENSVNMVHRDYEMKKEAYETLYGKALTYAFSMEDIAGTGGAEHRV